LQVVPGGPAVPGDEPGDESPVYEAAPHEWGLLTKRIKPDSSGAADLPGD
jgi:hypothetical protein